MPKKGKKAIKKIKKNTQFFYRNFIYFINVSVLRKTQIKVFIQERLTVGLQSFVLCEVERIYNPQVSNALSLDLHRP